MTSQPPANPPEDPDQTTDDPQSWLRLAEALIFASAEPIATSTLARLLPDSADTDTVLQTLQQQRSTSGVHLVQVAGGWQFRTAPDLAPKLRRIIQTPRRLPRVAMETLAIIAWRQPVTRTEIEELRGASLSQSTLDTLLEAALIEPKGHRDSPGRPTLWATTKTFLTQFTLQSLTDLPREDELKT